MTRKELQSVVLDNIGFGNLAQKISELNTEYSEIQLCAIAYRYSGTFDNAIYLLKLLEKSCKETNVAEYINKIICMMKKSASLFHEEDTDSIYELNIVLDRFSATEKYICRDYEAVLETISKWHKQYGYAPCDTTEYTVEKRRILKCNEPFREDVIAGCKLNSRLEVCGYYSSEYIGAECEESCDECEKICFNNTVVEFPNVVENCGLVYYHQPFFKNGYGVVIAEHSDKEDYYIVPLDGLHIGYRDFENALDEHIHIPKPYVRAADISEISGGKGTIGQLYREFVRYMESK
ncbi:MAG: hypothetical protein IKU43_01900 [Clostridia bacterium]|nr:hypothetical protein [Clostridia bacterium]